MRILIDLQHPAHLHFFRNAVHLLREDGHEVRLTGRDKDILVDLAREYGMEVEVFGTGQDGLLAMGGELVSRWWRLYGIVRRWRPDCMMAVAGTYVSLIGRLTGTPTHVFYDTEHATLSNMLAYPFCTCVYVPRCYRKPIRWNHRRYNGYHELAYLHPDYFTPDVTVLDELGVDGDEPYVVVRFVGWGAAHDAGYKGLAREQKRECVETLQQEARVFISAEGELPQDLEPLRMQLPYSRMHDVIAFASLVFGESGTMSSEAAILGVPAVYVNPLMMGYIEELQRQYGIVHRFTPLEFSRAIEAAEEMLLRGKAGTYDRVRDKLLSDTIDVTAMIEDVATGSGRIRLT